MRTLVITGAWILSTVTAFAQGQFAFGNKNLVSSPPIDSKVFLPDGVTPLSGSAFLAQAYIKLATEPDSSFTPIGSTVPFRTGTDAGYIVPTTLTTPYGSGTLYHAEMRAWKASEGATYEQAKTAGGLHGSSNAVLVESYVGLGPPSDMLGLQSFSLVPEPLPASMIVLGLVTLGLRRGDRWRQG